MPCSLRDVCTSLVQGPFGSGARLPERTKIGELAANLPEVVLATRKPRDLSQLAREIYKCIHSGDLLSRRQAREAPWCLWHKDTRLAEQPDALRTILDAVSEATRPSAFNALSTAFAECFDPGSVGMDEASTCLRQLASRWDSPWARLHADLAFFDMRLGPSRLAAAVIAQNRPASDIIRSYGIGAMGAKSGYTRAVTFSLLDQLANGGEPDHLARLEKVERYALDERGEPSFDGLLGKIAEALLKPFGQSKPERTLRDRFLSVLLRLLGDPRVPSQRNKWHHVPAHLTNLVRGWLTEQSLRQFVHVVAETTERPDTWAYRGEFWMAVYEAGLISEAWVAFGSGGARLARRIFGNTASFGRLEAESKGVDEGHTVLLLRIGNGVVADWSHNGKCNIWSDANSPTAPKLYRSAYGSDEVRIRKGSGNYESEAEFSVMHMSSETYSWQRKVAEKIYKMTGRRVQSTAYSVRR